MGKLRDSLNLPDRDPGTVVDGSVLIDDLEAIGGSEAIEAIIDAISETDSSSWYEKLKVIITMLVPLAEMLGKSGPEKKQLVLEALIMLYDRSGIDIPVLPRVLEHTLIRILANFLIDTIVRKFNSDGTFSH